MKTTYDLTPHTGLNQDDGSINVYHCNILLSNEFISLAKDGNLTNTGSIYMGYTKNVSLPASITHPTQHRHSVTHPTQPPADYNFVINLPKTTNNITIDFIVGIPTIGSVFTLLDNTGKIIDQKSLNFNPDATLVQHVILTAPSNKQDGFIVQVTANNPQDYIFYFYGCNITIG